MVLPSPLGSSDEPLARKILEYLHEHEDDTPASSFDNTSSNGIATAAGGEFIPAVVGNGTGAAAMAFHRPASFAAYFGLDTDNAWKVGGWSYGAAAYPIWHEGRGLAKMGDGWFGTHPAYPGYASAWMNGYTAAGQYGFLSNGANSFLNGTSAAYMRVGNADRFAVDSTRGKMFVPLHIMKDSTLGVSLEVAGNESHHYASNHAIYANMGHNGTNYHFDNNTGGTYLNWSYPGNPINLCADTVTTGRSTGGYGTFTCGILTSQNVQFSFPALLLDDVQTYRSASSNTSSLYMNSAKDRALQYNGTDYVFLGASINVNGTTYTSSRAYKKGIKTLPKGALARLAKLTPKRFSFKETPGEERSGFIYEEVIETNPEYAFEHANVDKPEEPIKGLDYNGIFVLNVQATQELTALVETQRQYIDSLETRLSALEARLTALEAA